MTESRTVRVVVRGRVQGVWYRGWTVAEAGARGLAGWVRNRSDGTVEAVFAGSAEAVEAMVAACRRGPPAAQVLDVAPEPWEENPGAGFHQRPTL